jgi:hypothetical protein
MAAEDYVGPPGYEKKLHKTHFLGGFRETMYDFSKDPDFYQVRPGVWRLKPRKVKPNGKENKKGRSTARPN